MFKGFLTKGKITLFSVLCVLSLISIGFASWTITGETIEELSGIIETDTIINSKEYVLLDSTKGDNNSGITCFKYYEQGYLDNEGYLSNYGYITTYYKLNLKKCYELLGSDYDSIVIDFKLQYADSVVLGDDGINLFKNATSATGSRTISATSSYESAYTGLPNIKMVNESNPEFPCYISQVEFKDILKNYDANTSPEYVEFKVEYVLFANVGEYFTNSVYQFLYSRAIGTENYTGFKVEIALFGM